MQYRLLGKTKLPVSVIGLGGVTISRVSPEIALTVMQSAFEQGINFIDTARSYGDSEEKIGKALRSHRGEVHLASKSRATDSQSMMEEIDLSLMMMQTDHIALYQYHDIREDNLDRVLAPGGAMDALLRAQREGKIGHIGFSGHRPQAVIPAIQTGAFSCVQIPLNIIDYPLFKDSIPAALEQDMGIIVMKPLCGGLLKSPPQALRFVLSRPVSTVIPGMDSVEQVMENTEESIQQLPLSEADMRDLEIDVERLGNDFCRRCGYCSQCPAGIEILDVFRFDRYYTSYFAEDWAREQYAELENHILDCINCGHCEDRCPYQLPVRSMLRTAHQRLNKATEK